MKHKLHIPIEEYGFIEIEDEMTSIDAVIFYKQVKRLFPKEIEELRELPNGLNTKRFAEIRKQLLLTGEFDVNLEQELNYQQLRWVKDTNNTLRQIKNKEE